ncbi:unnamed protein product [Cylindrotheca closterium]|uniref:Uncharacterized protein n=1 Tax=Cylindrotheca closterium TaxID=2856 RepID=A0AAD2FMK8_9STRA|nr:unnamed protein product [Cylindrotheca closterium]
MKIRSTAFLATLLSSLLTTGDAFQTAAVPPGGARNALASPSAGQASLAASSTADAESSPCAGRNDAIPESVTAQSLRSAVLTNVDGELVRLDEKMGKGTSIVVFLRHLG